MSIGISGGPNNTLGILVAAGALIVGGLAAGSYVKTGLKNDSDRTKMQKNKYKRALASAGMLGAGFYIGSQSFLPVVNDVLYKAPISSLGYAAAGALTLMGGVYYGLSYLRYRYIQKKRNEIIPAGTNYNKKSHFFEIPLSQHKIALTGFEPVSRAPKALVLGRYTTGLHH